MFLLALVPAAGLLCLLAIHFYVTGSAKERFCDVGQRSADCILVLGCKIQPDGQPTPMLRDRLLQAIRLYREGAAPTVLLSGNGRIAGNSESDTMLRFVTEAGVPKDAVVIDREGYTTFESIRRAKEMGYQTPLIVTQQYHLYRAVFIATRLKLDAYGVASDLDTYSHRLSRHVREWLAQLKAFLMCLFQN